MNRFAGEKNIKMRKRLTAILVAVVFVFGTAVVPAEIYGTESDSSTAGVQTVETVETTEASEPEIEQDATEEAPVQEEHLDEITEEQEQQQETQETESEEPAVEENPATEEIIEELNDAVTVDLDSIDEAEYDGLIYKLEDDVTRNEIEEMKDSIGELDEDQGQAVEEVIRNELYSADSIETIAEVAEPEMVEYIEPNYIARATGTNDYFYDEYGWYLEMIDAPYVWDKGQFGDGVTVAVLDTGIYKGHADFKTDTFVKSYNVFDNSTNVVDYHGHGTAVTGIIAAAYNNGRGLTGIMPNVKIMPVKVLDDNGMSSARELIAGIHYAANNGADVINLSASIYEKLNSMETECNNAADKGVIIVSSAGNEAKDRIKGVLNPMEYPASHDSVISVGSVDKKGAWSSFSTYNNKLTVTAPGENMFIVGSPYNPDYTGTTDSPYYSGGRGTSFSCPEVAAMAAMIKQMKPDIDCDGFKSVIAGSSIDKGAAGYDPYYGYGVMNLKNAYRHITEKDISVYDVSLSATSYTFDGKQKTPSVTVKQTGETLSPDYYKTTYAAGRKDAGTYTVTVEGRNGYTGKKTLTFKINGVGFMSSCQVALSASSFAYNGKVKTPSVTIRKAGKTVTADHYKTTYAAGRKAIGSYKVTVVGENGLLGTKTLSFDIVPPLVKAIKKPTRGKKKLTVRWKAMSKKQKKKYKSAITGYQVRVATNKQFTDAKYANAKGIKKTKKVVKGLKKKTTYYVQYRSYKTIGSKTYYSKWSSIKKAKTK